MSTAKVTLINKRDGKERYTRHEMSDVVEMIRTGKLKSGKDDKGPLPVGRCI